MSIKHNYFSDKFISKPEDKITIGFAYEPCTLSDEIKQLRGVPLSVRSELISIMATAGIWPTICDPPHFFKSVARCSETDDWDEETGKKITDARNRIKFHDYRIRQLNKMAMVLSNLLNIVENMLDAKYEALFDAYAELKKYTGEEAEHESH